MGNLIAIGGTSGSTATPQQSTGGAVAPPTGPVEPVRVGGQFTFSGYGNFIPLVYGSFIVSGNVFWQSAWKENTFTNKKTTPPTKIITNYCDFAVGLCEGPIDDVLRIWIGERLVFDKRVILDDNGEPIPTGDRRTVGRFTETGIYLPNIVSDAGDGELSVGLTPTFTIFRGGADQLPPEVMYKEEGVGKTPAYRDTAYILFQNYFQNDTSPPEIFVEVVANTQQRVARQYLEFPDNGLWRDVGSRLVLDPALSVVYARARALTPNTGPDDGFVSINALNMTVMEEHQFYDFTGETFDGAYIPRPEYLCSPLPGGQLLVGGFDGNDGFLLSASPWGQTGLDFLRRNDTGTDHKDSGPTAPGEGSLAFQYIDEAGEEFTVVAVTALGGGLNHIGFAALDSDYQITWHGYLNGVLAQDQGVLGDFTVAKLMALTVDEELAALFPTFPDGATTLGQHIYAFTIFTDDSENESVALHVDRVTVRDGGPTTVADLEDILNSGASIDNPQHTYVGTIDLNAIGGKPLIHQIVASFVDPVDFTYVMAISVGGDFDVSPDCIIKWSPFTGDLVYSTALPARLPTNAASGNANVIIGSNRQWAYASPDNEIITVDLKTGVGTIAVADTVEEGIGSTGVGDIQYSVWLGDEGALIIPINDELGGVNLVKVWPTRRGGNKAPLRAVVVDLLIRAGWDPALIQFSTAVDEIEVTGYVIQDKKDVRGALSELKQVFGFDVVESTGSIQYAPRGGAAAAVIPIAQLKQADEGSLIEVIDTDVARLRKVSIKYFDIDRDYDSNVQQAVLPEIGVPDFTAESYIDVDVPLVLTAGEAKILAEGMIYQKQTYETNYQFSLPPKYLTLDPGDVIEIEDEATTLKMRVRNTDRGADKEIRIEAVTEDPDIYNDTIDLFTEAGRFESVTIGDEGPSIFFKGVPLPWLTEEAAKASDLTLATYGQDTLNDGPYAGRDIYVMYWFDMNPAFPLPSYSFDNPNDPSRFWNVYVNDGIATRAPYRTRQPLIRPTWGYARKAPNAGGGVFHLDDTSTLVVNFMELGAIQPTSVTVQDIIDDPLVNTCALNGEVLQYATATLNPNGTYTLTNLLRARVGTDIPAQSHGNGGLFVQLTNHLGEYPLTPSVQSILFAELNGPVVPVRASLDVEEENPYQRDSKFTFECTNYKPYAPVSPMAVESSGDLILTWQRRERWLTGDEWPEDGDEDAGVPTGSNSRPGEYTTQWEIFLTETPWTGFGEPPTFLRNVTVTDVETWTYTAAMQTEDTVDIATDTLYGYVRHIGGVTGRETGWPCKFTIVPGA